MLFNKTRSDEQQRKCRKGWDGCTFGASDTETNIDNVSHQFKAHFWTGKRRRYKIVIYKGWATINCKRRIMDSQGVARKKTIWCRIHCITEYYLNTTSALWSILIYLEEFNQFWLLAFSRLLTRRPIKSMYMYKHGFSTYKHTKKPVLFVRDKWKTISGCADKVKSLTRSFRGAGETNQTYIPSSDFATPLQVLRLSA